MYSFYLLLYQNHQVKPIFGFTYLHAERRTFGIWANTIDKGPTVIGFVESTYTGSKGGISPAEFTLKAFPFSNMIWLCIFLSGAVKWYSRLAGSSTLWWGNLLNVKSTLTWTEVLLSKLSNSIVIPFCKRV